MTAPDRRWYWIAALPSGLYVLLHLLAWVLSPALWGADALIYYGPWTTAAFLAVPLVALIIPGSALPSSLRRLGARATQSRLFPWLLCLGAIPLLWLGRVRTHSLGDSVKWFEIIRNAVERTRSFDEIPWHNASLNLPGLEFINYQEALDLAVHAAVYALLHACGGRNVETAYASVSIIAGGLYLVALWSLSRRFANSAIHHIAIFGFFASLGTLQLFCGYGESYTLVTLLCALYLTFAVDSLRGQRPL